VHVEVQPVVGGVISTVHVVKRLWRGTRRHPRVTVGVVAALVVFAVLAGWQLTRFPAVASSVPGTPVSLHVQDGVPAKQVDDIRRGVRAQAALLAAAGSPLTDPVEVRVSWSQGCRPPWTGPTSIAAAWAEAGFVCLNAAHPGWAGGVGQDDWFPAYVSAHELVHTWQAQLGCHRKPEEQQWLWLFEGMADQLAFTALEDAGIVGSRSAARRIRALGGLDPRLGSLVDHERATARSGAAYPLFHLAARVLVQGGASPTGFARFCRSAGSGTPWREAFAVAFDVPVDELYRRVEAERARLAARSDGG